MDAGFIMRIAGTAALVVLATPSWAGGRGGQGPVFHSGGGFRGGVRGSPPASGVIQRFGPRPSSSAYGHTNTAMRGGIYRVRQVSGYGHATTGLQPWHPTRYGFGGYGHTRTALGLGYDRQGGGGARAFGNRLYGGRLRLSRARRRFLLGFGGGYGGFGGGYGGYDGAGTDGGSWTYGTSGPYGSGRAYTDAGVGGSGQTGVSYVSETPLAARFAEPPLAPSPFAPPGDGDRYADAASEDVGYGLGPRVIIVGHPPRPDCACASRIRPAPVVYRYGVGTAY